MGLSEFLIALAIFFIPGIAAFVTVFLNTVFPVVWDTIVKAFEYQWLFIKTMANANFELIKLFVQLSKEAFLFTFQFYATILAFLVVTARTIFNKEG